MNSLFKLHHNLLGRLNSFDFAVCNSKSKRSVTMLALDQISFHTSLGLKSMENLSCRNGRISVLWHTLRTVPNGTMQRVRLGTTKNTNFLSEEGVTILRKLTRKAYAFFLEKINRNINRHKFSFSYCDDFRGELTNPTFKL